VLKLHATTLPTGGRRDRQRNKRLNPTRRRGDAGEDGCRRLTMKLVLQQFHSLDGVS
jgi:hypothetical protein